MKFLKKLFRRKENLDDYLDPKQRVYVRGIYFTIRKLNVLDHMHGAKILTESYKVPTIDERRQKNEAKIEPVSRKKIHDHYRDVFLQCVVDPVFVRKEEEAGPGKTHVDRLFLDWAIADELYIHIMKFTYGKKKIRRILRQSHLLGLMS